MNKTDPDNIMYRMLRDSVRLSNWAKRKGTPKQQEKASQLVDALTALRPLYQDATILNVMEAQKGYD